MNTPVVAEQLKADAVSVLNLPVRNHDRHGLVSNAQPDDEPDSEHRDVAGAAGSIISPSPRIPVQKERRCPARKTRCCALELLDRHLRPRD